MVGKDGTKIEGRFGSGGGSPQYGGYEYEINFEQKEGFKPDIFIFSYVGQNKQLKLNFKLNNISL